MDTGELNAGVTLWWISIPSREKYNVHVEILSHFRPPKPDRDKLWLEGATSLICRLNRYLHWLKNKKSGAIWFYYSFKIFPSFWLVKTGSIIHNNQVLFTEFGKNLHHIESMTSKVQPAADYWTVDLENLGTRLCYFWWAEKQRAKFCRSRRVLSTLAFGLCG